MEAGLVSDAGSGYSQNVFPEIVVEEVRNMPAYSHMPNQLDVFADWVGVLTDSKA